MAPVFVASSILSPKLSANHTIRSAGGNTGTSSLKDLHLFGFMFSFHSFRCFPLVDIWSISIVFIYRIFGLHIILHLFIIQAHTHTKYCQTFQKQQMFNTPVDIIQFQKKNTGAGSEIRRTNQLRLVVEIGYQVFISTFFSGGNLSGFLNHQQYYWP